ncbi:Panacea domain-containing protein [Xanthobacter aminoxidans]|uniref:Panacea domain-containing protein n=1 Tax=Xanthobacter aminoxidans TaxID=186280 RepID=UPI00372B8129
MAHWYNSRKAAQIAAFFAKRQGGKINILKLVKLLYLADREFMNRFDMSMLNDKLVSMDNGPVLSATLDKINGFSRADGWCEFVTDRENHFVGIASPDLQESSLDELSRAELRCLSDVWSEFGHMSQWDLVEYTHKFCPEWEDPNGSSLPIPYERLFKALGKENSAELDYKIRVDRKISALLRD